MPDLTSIATAARRGGFNFTGFMSIIPQTVVLAGTVTAIPTYPALAVAYTLTSGSESNVTQDMTVIFRSSTGVFKSRLRIASGATTTSTSLKVNEFAAGAYDVTVGDTFQVVSEYRIWDRLVSATAALNKDSRIAYSDQGSNPNPVCNSGGASPGFSTSRDFYGSTSFTIDPDASGTINHTWNYIDGSGTTNVANPTGVTFPVGFRWVKHTATDATNSKATVQYVPVWVHDNDTYPPLRVQMDNLSTQATNPARVSFKLPFEDQGSIENLPDGALVCYWEREYYNGTEASYGSNVTGRSHVKFVGYLLRDSISIDPDQNEVAFEATNSLGILELTPALPQLMVSDSTPANWQEVKTLSTKKIFWYLSYWGASLQTGWDFVWTDGLDLNYSRIAVDGNNSIADQLRDIANSLNVQVTCDQLGRIQFIRDPDFLTTVQRASRTTAYDFTTADMMRIEWTNEHNGSIKNVRGEAITESGAAVFAKAPGAAPSSIGTGSDTLAKQIVTNQADIIARTNYHYARVNSLYNGRSVPKGLRLTVPDGYDFLDPANREFVTLTLPTSTNTRGVSFANTERWTVESKDVTYDPERGTKDIVYTLDHETIGTGAIADPPPPESQNGVADYPPFNTQFLDYGLDTVQQTGGLVGGTTTIAKFHTNNTYEITTNFENGSVSGGPSWVNVDLTVLAGWPGGTLSGFTVDAYSPKYLGTGTAVNGWIVTSTSVMRILDIFGTPSLTGIVTLHGNNIRRSMQFERGVQNWGIISSWVDSDGIWVAYTTDGTTWTENQVDADYMTNVADGWWPGLWLDPHNAGVAYTSKWGSTAGIASNSGVPIKTGDYGATWSTLADPDLDLGSGLAMCIAAPYADTTGKTAYYAHSSGAGTLDPRLYRSISTSPVDISPTYSAAPYGPYVYPRSIAIADGNRNVLVICALNEYVAGSDVGVFMTINAESAVPTWTVLVTPSPSVPYHQVYAGSASAIYLIGDGGAIAFSDGSTVDSRIGNSANTSEVLGICGG
jgi:hypothetical protein